MQTLRDYISELFHYRMTTGENRWEMFANDLRKSGQWSITASPSKFESIIVDLCKRVEKLEQEKTHDIINS